jgi:hypothetical protein
MKIDLSKEHVKFLKVFLHNLIQDLLDRRAKEINDNDILDIESRKEWLDNLSISIITLDEILKKLER